MSEITLKGNVIHTNGELPKPGIDLGKYKFSLTGKDLTDLNLKDLKGKRIVMNIFVSLDTSTCATSVRKFNAEAEKLDNTVVLCISRDLPFAQNRFCVAEGLENVITLSEMRNNRFGDLLGIRIMDGPMAGLLARSVIVLKENLQVIYSQLVPEISQEPDYSSALEVLK